MTNDRPSWDESVDLVIIGSGGGSLCSALLAQSRGKKAVIFEKQAKLGGSTSLSGGVLWIPNHPLQARDGVQDSYEDGMRYLTALAADAGPASSLERRHVYVSEGPKMIDFLQKLGMQFIRVEGWSDYHDELPGGKCRGRSLGVPLFDGKKLGDWLPRLALFMNPPVPMKNSEFPKVMLAMRSLQGARAGLTILGRSVWGKLTGKFWLNTGAALQGRLLQIAVHRNVDLRLESPVSDLVTDQGRVVGVVTMQNGRPWRVGATAGVLINAGGYSRNAAMRDQVGEAPVSTDWSFANPGDTGDLINAAAKLGAATDLMDMCWWVPTSFPPDRAAAFHVQDMGKPHAILVDASGQRFVDEPCSYVALGLAMYRRHTHVPAVPAWLVRDSRHHDWYPFGGVFKSQMPKSWFESGYIIKADTLEALARQCRIDPVGLCRTVERFNRFARTGIDEDFHRGERAYDRYYADPRVKPNPSLGSIDKPPYYATKIYPGDVGTAGGLLTDENARVLRMDGSVIEGLYATGNSTASVMGRSYPGAGASIGAAFVWGWVATHHALAIPGIAALPPAAPTTVVGPRGGGRS